MAKVLVIGSGGREHALSWKLSQSSNVRWVYVAPGNAATDDAQKNMSNIDINIEDHNEIANWSKKNDIDIVVVGPEDPLANGLSDYLSSMGIKCFGPCQKAAQIEASKAFAKNFMEHCEIPTARWKSFTDADNAKKHIMSAPYNALVVKASGLAAGKGVIVAKTREEAVNAIDQLKQDKGLSTASETIVIEELLEGEEVSVLCFSDGVNICVMPPAQDHKRLLDNDEGPNTGGMGAYCRCPNVSEKDLEFIKKDILQRAIKGMKKEGFSYVGVLYAGLMMTKDGPKVLEYNCRFGDPETQVILPLLESDLYEVMLACIDGKLNELQVNWSKENHAVGVVLVSGGYPGSYPKGKIITGFDQLSLQHPECIAFHAGTKLDGQDYVTSGGRVLAVVAIDKNLQGAAEKAQKGAQLIAFEGAFFRKDIAHHALKRSQYEGLTYKSSGVDIESADNLVRKIKELTKQTQRSGICSGIGGFGGVFDIKAVGYTDSYLISRGKGLKDKLKVAQICNAHKKIGFDLVASCVNDIVCHGAEALYFLDTFTCGKLDVRVASQVISGIAEGCQRARCALIGGETAEMPGMYKDGDYDLIGFSRGAVQKSYMLPLTSEICDGDVVIGITTSAINSSSFDLIQRIVEKKALKYKDPAPFDASCQLGDILLAPSSIYVGPIISLRNLKLLKAVANTTDEGIEESMAGIMPEKFGVDLDASLWIVPKFYKWIAQEGNLKTSDMMKMFNLGLGMILIVSPSYSRDVIKNLNLSGEHAVVIGSVVSKEKGRKTVNITNWDESFTKEPKKKKKVGVLLSGSGPTLKTLIRHTQNPVNMSTIEIAIVISNYVDAAGIKIAEQASIPAKVLLVEDTEAFCTLASDSFRDFGVDVIFLDDFSMPLSNNFCNLWNGKIVKIHPSILPAFENDDAVQQALDLGVRITGCTACILQPEMPRIIDQAAAFVDINETATTLQNKLKRLRENLCLKSLDLAVKDSNFKCLTGKGIVTTADISSFEDLHSQIEDLKISTGRQGWCTTLNSKCGIFDLETCKYQDPYLVSGTDGVGTKLKIAQTCNQHDTIGIDLVAMCVNDILTHGAEPLFFLECFGCDKVDPQVTASVVAGVAEGCRQANCALLGAEISQMPHIYSPSEDGITEMHYDVVGFAEGAMEKNHLLPRTSDIKEGDVIIGLASSGVHSNGYSLVRKIVEVKQYRYQDPAPFDKSRTLGDILLTPTKIYVRSVLPLMRKGLVKAAAHITGGGLLENIPRILPDDKKVVLDASKWTVPPVLKWLEKEGRLPQQEMLKTFNCGLGMTLLVSKEHQNQVLKSLSQSNEVATAVGYVAKKQEGDEKVQVVNWTVPSESIQSKKKVGVLISGSGTNLQALIDYTQNPANLSAAEIVLVLSNKAGVEGLKRAERAHISTKVLNHKDYKSRVEFDMAVHEILKANRVEIVCLAGFMRILSQEFVHLWQGKLLNVHPAILPAFKGMHTHQRALDTGSKIVGCSVHFVEPEVDAGAIVEQAAIRIHDGETAETLQERVKALEHKIFPRALELLASNRIYRAADGKLKWLS